MKVTTRYSTQELSKTNSGRKASTHGITGPILSVMALVALILVLTAPGLADEDDPQAPAERSSAEENYQLSVRDQIRLTVYDEPDLTIEQRIDGQGQVRIPLIGTTRLAGMTVRQAEQFLERTYVEQQFLRDPMVTIRVEDYAPKEVSVLGAVASPGKLAFPIEANTLDIVDVISKVGGFTDIARSNRVRVTRGSNAQKSDFTVNVERMITGRGRGDSEETFEILPGDVIWVPERLF